MFLKIKQMQLSLEVCLSSCKNAQIDLRSYNTLMIDGSSVCFFTHIWLFARSSSAQFRLTFCSMSEPVSSSGSYAGFGCPSNKSFTLTPALDTWVQYNSCWWYKWLQTKPLSRVQYKRQKDAISYNPYSGVS